MNVRDIIVHFSVITDIKWCCRPCIIPLLY